MPFLVFLRERSVVRRRGGGAGGGIGLPGAGAGGPRRPGQFALACEKAGICAVHGVSLPVAFGDRVLPVTFLAESGAGYANVCRMLSLAYAAGGREAPLLDSRLLAEHSAGIIILVHWDCLPALRELVRVFRAGQCSLTCADIRLGGIRSATGCGGGPGSPGSLRGGMLLQWSFGITMFPGQGFMTR